VRPLTTWGVTLGLGLALAGAAPARAHENTRAYGQLELQEAGARLTLFARYEDWDQAVGKLDASGDGRLDNAELAPRAAEVNRWLAAAIAGRSQDGACPAAMAPPTVALRGRELYLRSTLAFTCATPIRHFTLSYDLFARLHPGHRMVASVRAGGAESTHIFATGPAGPAMLTLERGPSGGLGGLGASLGQFVALGAKHILTGYDHLLFLLALLLASTGRRQLLITISAFTAAHSLTLAAAVLHLLRPPAAVIEPAIALSIVLVAAQNLRRGARGPDGAAGPGARYLVTFALGLLHGFGFAGVLLEMDLARGPLAASLLGFNLGVELGQLALVLVSYPALLWLRRQPFQLPARRLASAGILAAGLVWLVVRLPQ
jgi:hypothetical protein